MAETINMEQLAELLTKLREDIRADIRSDIQEEIQLSEERTKREIIAYIENGVEKDIKTLAEGHRLLLDRLPADDRVDDLNDRVTTVETVMTHHTQELSDIKKKMAI